MPKRPKPKPRPRPRPYILALLLFACSPSELQHARETVNDVRYSRDMLCAAAALHGVKKIVELCETDATVRDLVGVWGGCVDP